MLTSINTLRAQRLKMKRTPQAIEDLAALTADLLELIRKSQWQTEGLPILSDKEGLDRANTNNENIYYDGDDNLFIAGANSIKDLINDLTTPLRLIYYTDSYNQAQQLYTDNQDKFKTIMSRSLGSVLAYHTIVEHRQLKGRL